MGNDLQLEKKIIFIMIITSIYRDSTLYQALY